MINNLVLSLYLMLISPVFAIITGMKNRNSEIRKWILIFAVTIYGSTINLAEGSDGFQHREDLYFHYLDLGFGEFFEELFAILTFSPYPETNDDVFIHSLSYFVGSVIGIPQLFFVFVAFIYAYFFVGSMFKVFKVIPRTKLSYMFYFFAFIFILQKNVEGINTVRTWTGLWVLFYSVISYFETKKLKYRILMFTPPLFHVGYFLMAIPAWFVSIFGSRFKYGYTILFFISFFYGLNQNSVIEQLQRNELGESKTRAYYVEDQEAFQKTKIKENQNWYVRLNKEGISKYPINIIIFSLIFGGIYFKGMDKLESNLFSIGILTKSLSNFSFFLFALASRSSLIGTVFILAAFILLLKRGYFLKTNIPFIRVYRLMFFVAALLYIPFIFFKMADLILFISIFMLALPFLPWFFNELNISIRELFGYFIS